LKIESRSVTAPVLIALSLTGCKTVTLPAPASYQGLAQQVATAAARQGGTTIGVVFIDPAREYSFGVGDTVHMHAASTMKVPVLIEVFKQADAGRFKLTDSLPVRNQFRSIADSSTYELSAADDSDSTLYKRIGGKATIAELARLMIVRSSNLATNLLIDLVTPAAVRKTLADAGVTGMNVQRGVEDTPAFRKGMNNTTTAAGLAGALELLLDCKGMKKSSCQEMLNILSGQEFNEMIPALLPAGTRVAHKTGSITGIRHDGGIVFRPDGKPYVLVILTRGFEKATDADRFGADISRLIWDAATKAR
jgi:beta-lactamase class A